MLSLAATIVLAGYLFTVIPKGFFPQQDTGRMIGSIQADQSISFQLMEKKLQQFVDIIRHDPAVENVVGFTGGFQTNSGFLFVVLKPLSERHVSVMQVIGRLRPKLNEVAGARLFLQPVQDIWVGGRQSNAQYQYTLQGDDTKEIYEWAPKVEAALQKIPLLTEVNLDQQQKGLESDLVLDRNTAARLGLSVSQIDNTLYDAFGQRQVSVIYAAQNQYHVVMEVAPEYLAEPGNAKRHLHQHQRRPGQRHKIDQCARRHDSTAPAIEQTARHYRRARSPATPRATRRTTRSPIPAAARPRPARRLAPLPKPWCRYRPSLISNRAIRRSRSITRACLSPRRSRSIWPRAYRWARRSRRSIEAVSRLDMPATVRGGFQGTAASLPTIPSQ